MVGLRVESGSYESNFNNFGGTTGDFEIKDRDGRIISFIKRYNSSTSSFI
jgi:hypothetical protein